MTDEKYKHVKKSKEAMIKTISEIEIIAADIVRNLSSDTTMVLHSTKKSKIKK